MASSEVVIKVDMDKFKEDLSTAVDEIKHQLVIDTRAKIEALEQRLKALEDGPRLVPLPDYGRHYCTDWDCPVCGPGAQAGDDIQAAYNAGLLTDDGDLTQLSCCFEQLDFCHEQ